MNADQILVLDRGRVVQMGTHQELIQQEGIYKRIYDMQGLVKGKKRRMLDFFESCWSSDR